MCSIVLYRTKAPLPHVVWSREGPDEIEIRVGTTVGAELESGSSEEGSLGQDNLQWVSNWSE